MGHRILAYLNTYVFNSKRKSNVKYVATDGSPLLISVFLSSGVSLTSPICWLVINDTHSVGTAFSLMMHRTPTSKESVGGSTSTWSSLTAFV